MQCDSTELTSVDTECAQNVPTWSLDWQRNCAVFDLLIMSDMRRQPQH